MKLSVVGGICVCVLLEKLYTRKSEHLYGKYDNRSDGSDRVIGVLNNGKRLTPLFIS